jgi:hypothetical protein
MIDDALYYATLGYPIFPCVPTKKKPLTANGWKDATVDAAHIRNWYTKTSTANIGLPA